MSERLATPEEVSCMVEHQNSTDRPGVYLPMAGIKHVKVTYADGEEIITPVKYCNAFFDVEKISSGQNVINIEVEVGNSFDVIVDNELPIIKQPKNNLLKINACNRRRRMG